jgi:predicted Zn-dependent protease
VKKTLLLLFITLSLFSCRKENTDPAYLPNSYSDQSLGASANDLLSAAKYTTLTVQVQYMPGYQLDTNAINNVTAYLNTLCNKPSGITITQSQIAANGDTLNPERVAILERQNRTAYTNGSTIALYIIVTDGYDTSGTVLGFAYRNTSICLFGKSIVNNSGGLFEPSRVSLESSVLEHELGHIMGLVNLGTPMVTSHQDVAHGNHCSNPACLMYYSIDVYDGSNLLHPNNIPILDSNCRADLHANGGK